MDDPITRAKNGDTSYFKRAPVDEWVKALEWGEGDSVLGNAIASNHIHCAKVIYGRCPKLLHQQSKKKGYTVLHHAAYGEEMPSLLKFMISVAETELHRKTFSDGYLEGMTALRHSIWCKQFVSARLLIEADPDHLTYVDKEGMTPLLHALSYSYGKTDGYGGSSLLLDKQPNAIKIRTGKHGWTALHHATFQGNMGAIEDIIRYCPDSVHMVDNDGQDFLDIAVTADHSEVVRKVLLRKEIWNGILQVSNIEGIEKLLNFKSDHGKKKKKKKKKKVLNVVKTMSNRENLILYREFVNQYGKIVQRDLLSLVMEEDPTYLALESFLNDVSAMFDVNTDNISQDTFSDDWQKITSQYNAMGLQVSWFPKLVAQYSDWLAKRAEHLSHLEDEIATKKTIFATKQEGVQIKLRPLWLELNELETELRELQEQHVESGQTEFG